MFQGQTGGVSLVFVTSKVSPFSVNCDRGGLQANEPISVKSESRIHIIKTETID